MNLLTTRSGKLRHKILKIITGIISKNYDKGKYLGNVCMKKLILFLAISLMFGCNKKTSPGPVLDGTLKGRWKMTDQYLGNAGGTETHMVLTYNIFYKYTATDSLYITDPAVTMPRKLLNVTDSTYLIEGNPKLYTYYISADKLELKNPCDYGCRWLFVKVE